jgi:hypothetical protein
VIRKLIFGGVLAVVLVTAPGAFAGTAPRATLARKADAICRADNASIAHFKHKPPNLDKIWSFTPKQLEATSGYWDELVAVATHETTRLFALGTPSEPAARTAWNRWLALTTTYGLPFMKTVAAASKRGDLQAVRTAFSQGGSQDAEAAKLIKSLGITLCRFI